MRTIEWRNGKVATLDQTKLPEKTVIIEFNSAEEVAEAIKTMKMRGAPLLGAAAAYALALTAFHSKAKNKERLVSELEEAAQIIRSTRPTAVNLFWALDRILDAARSHGGSVSEIAALVVAEANKVADEDAQANRLIGKFGAELIKDGDTVLTHCNAGALATCEYGTALGVIRAAWEQGKKVRVIADETRPLLQGARLTAYELEQMGTPTTLITDNMVGFVMYNRMVNEVVVGADRIVRDAVINKIGTYGVAVLAKEHGIPFYVAAPKSTFDLEHTSADIIIEERKPEEVTEIYGHRIAPKGIRVFNPAFDITPLKYVTAIICEQGVLRREEFAKFKANLSESNRRNQD